MADRLAVLAFGPARKIVGCATGEIFNGLDAILAEPHQHSRRDPFNLHERVFDAKLTALGVKLGLDAVEVFTRAILQFGCGVLIETFDAGDFFGVDHRQLFD